MIEGDIQADSIVTFGQLACLGVGAELEECGELAHDAVLVCFDFGWQSISEVHKLLKKIYSFS